MFHGYFSSRIEFQDLKESFQRSKFYQIGHNGKFIRRTRMNEGMKRKIWSERGSILEIPIWKVYHGGKVLVVRFKTMEMHCGKWRAVAWHLLAPRRRVITSPGTGNPSSSNFVVWKLRRSPKAPARGFFYNIAYAASKNRLNWSRTAAGV